MGPGKEPEHQPTTSWRAVKLGIAVPRSYICVCCLASDGVGMDRHGLTYCMSCWETRQKGDTCTHEMTPERAWDQHTWGEQAG